MPNDKDTKNYLIVTLGISLLGTFIYIFLTSILYYDEFRQTFFLFHIWNIYPYFLIMAILLITFAAILMIRSYKNQFSSLYILILAIVVFGLSYLFGFFNFDPTGGNFRQTTLFQLQILSQTTGTFLFYMHFELNSRDQPTTSLLGTVVFLLTPYSVLNIYYLISNQYTDNLILENFQFFSTILLQIGTILIFGWLLLNAIQITIMLFNRDVQSKHLASVQLAGIFILFIGLIFQAIEFLSPLDVWHTPLNVISLLLIVGAYMKDPNILLFAPVNVLLFGIIDNGGRTLYFKPIDEAFQDEKTMSSTSELFGGLTLAFTSLGKEVAQSQKGVDSLQFGDRSIIIESLFPYYLVVIANRSTFFLQLEMEEYLLDLKRKYPKLPKDGTTIPTEVFEKLNRRFFPTITK